MKNEELMKIFAVAKINRNYSLFTIHYLPEVPMPLTLTEKELAGLLKKSRYRLPALTLNDKSNSRRAGACSRRIVGVVFKPPSSREGDRSAVEGVFDVPQTKYKNQKVTYMGIEFDSQLEANRYADLILMQRAGEITDLRRQVEFELIPCQREPDIVGPRGGIKPGKVIERAVHYIADFVYKDKQGNTVVEDTKGIKTPDYTIKRKLMLWIHEIRITEVTE